MKEELLKYTCDRCGDNVIVPAGNYINTILHANWIRMYIKDKPFDVYKTKKHFCCEVCVIKYLQEKLENEN
jgi:hypothetical protein